MTEKEWRERQNELQKQFDGDSKSLAREYAFANNPYSKGDVIEDHIGKIRITDIVFYYRHSYPSYLIYRGDNLLKTGQVSKREPVREVYQVNIKK